MPMVSYVLDLLHFIDQLDRNLNTFFFKQTAGPSPTHQARATLMHPYCPMPFACFFILFSCLISPYHACSQLDRQSLLSISVSFSPPPSTPLNWSSIDCCFWEGIACDRNGWVTHLWLPSRGLKGGISPSLRNLTHLSHLNLSHNGLVGQIPDDFFASFNLLEIVDLSFNGLHGELPPSFPSNNSPFSIQTMDLSSNYFHGTIQSSFLPLAWNLLNFNISNNSFTGPIPSSICINSSLLRLLDISFNDFTGQILPELGECSKLEVFHAGFNSLSGQLPNDIYRILTLQEISLPFNKLSGQIDNGIIHLTNLTILEFYDNELSGMLPQGIGKLSNLEKLLLHVNDFSGTIPTSLMNCTFLEKLNLGFNFFEGEISTLNFSNLVLLTALDLGGNNFTGQLPISLYSCKSLTAVRVSRNKLEGQILPEMLALQSLSFLSLAENKFTNISGAIRILMSCKNLSILLLSGNFVNEVMPNDDNIVDSNEFQNIRALGLSTCQLIGRVPTWLSKLMKLETLDLSSNQLFGPIPSWLGSLPGLSYIRLSNNLIKGELPQELCRLLALTSEKAAAEADHSFLELSLFDPYNKTGAKNNSPDRQYNRLSGLPTTIDLSNNSLSGNIPIEIGQLIFLHRLNLSHNNFSGNIPDQISNLHNLERLDLSQNCFSGEIPQSLTSLDFLAEFNVSHNKLRGRIPLGTQLQSFSGSAYEGNLELCGLPLSNQCPVGGVNEEKSLQDEDGDESIPWFYVSMGLGFITGFWATCSTLLFNHSWRYAYFQFLTNIKDRLLATLVRSL